MKLEQLFPDFHSMEPGKQVAFVEAYRLRRTRDLQTYLDDPAPKEKKPRAKKKITKTFSPDELALLEKMGLSKLAKRKR